MTVRSFSIYSCLSRKSAINSSTVCVLLNWTFTSTVEMVHVKTRSTKYLSWKSFIVYLHGKQKIVDFINLHNKFCGVVEHIFPTTIVISKKKCVILNGLLDIMYVLFICNFKILVRTLKLYRLFISQEYVVKISAIHNFTTTNVNITMTQGDNKTFTTALSWKTGTKLHSMIKILKYFGLQISMKTNKWLLKWLSLSKLRWIPFNQNVFSNGKQIKSNPIWRKCCLVCTDCVKIGQGCEMPTGRTV